MPVLGQAKKRNFSKKLARLFRFTILSWCKLVSVGEILKAFYFIFSKVFYFLSYH